MRRRCYPRRDRPVSSLDTTARGLLRSTGAATASQLARILAIQATHIVVRRLIPPEQWGPWIWAEVLFVVLATVRDLGVPSHVLRLRPMPLGNLLALEAGWGAALAGLMALGAPLVAQAFATPSPELVAILRVLCVSLLVEGLAAVFLTGYEGTLRIERALAPELLRTGLYCSAVLGFALAGAGLWSFVAAQVISQLAFAFELWRRGRREFELTHLPGATSRLVRESLPLGWIWLLMVAVAQVDSFIVGGLFPAEAVGTYAFAYAYAFLVYRVLQPPIARTIYPAFVAFEADATARLRTYRLGTVAFLACEVPAALFLALNAEAFVLLLGGERWLAAAPLLQILAFAPLVDPIGRFGGELLISRRRDRLRVLALALNLAALVIAGVWLCRRLGVAGMAWANFLPLGAPVVWWGVWRETTPGERLRLARELAEVYLAPVVPFAAAWWLAGERRWLRFALCLIAAFVSLAWAWRRHRADLRGLFALERERAFAARAPGQAAQ